MDCWLLQSFVSLYSDAGNAAANSWKDAPLGRFCVTMCLKTQKERKDRVLVVVSVVVDDALAAQRPCWLLDFHDIKTRLDIQFSSP